MKKFNLKSIKNFTIGLLVGMTIISTGSAYASTLSLEKVQAYLNYDLMITHNGKNVLLSNAPITYNGKTYLPLTDVGSLTNTSIKYNQKERSVEMTTNKEDTNVENLNRYADSISSKYGFEKVYKYGDKEYINSRDVAISLKNFDFTFDSEKNRLSLVEINSGDVILADVEYSITMVGRSLEYNYYLNTILPLTK